jgi:hypothetical protein
MRGAAPAEGEVVVLEVHRQPSLAAITDALGTASLTLDHGGPASVRTLDGLASAALQLRRGVFREGRWYPAVTEVALDLSR